MYVSILSIYVCIYYIYIYMYMYVSIYVCIYDIYIYIYIYIKFEQLKRGVLVKRKVFPKFAWFL